MEPMTRALVLASVILVASLAAGALPMWRRIQEHAVLLRWMTGIAAGVLLASATLVAIPEGFEISMEHGDDHVETLVLGGAVLAGFLMMMMLESFGFGHDVHEEHHDHEEDHGHDHVHHPSKASSIVLGLSIHALTDGLAIGASIASGSLVLTLSVYAAVLVHKLPAAFSVGVFSLHERGDRSAAMRDLVLFSLATPVMILLTFLMMGGLDESWIGLAVLFSGGTFLYVATIDVLPQVHDSATGRSALLHVLVGAGTLVLLLLGLDALGLSAH